MKHALIEKTIPTIGMEGNSGVTKEHSHVETSNTTHFYATHHPNLTTHSIYPTLPLSFDGLDYIQCYQQLSKWNDQHRNVQDACTWDDDVIVTYDTCNSIVILNP